METAFIILSWDISEQKFAGPFETAENARSYIEDNRDEFFENVMIIGPLPCMTIC